MKQIERDLDKKVADRLSKIHRHPNWALEVKYANGKLKPHQEAALKQVEDGKFLYKIPDTGKRNPFDYIRLGDADAIVCTIHKNERDVTCRVNDIYEFNMRI